MLVSKNANNTEVVVISFSPESSQPRDQPLSPALPGGFFYHWATKEASAIISPAYSEML